MLHPQAVIRSFHKINRIAGDNRDIRDIPYSDYSMILYINEFLIFSFIITRYMG